MIVSEAVGICLLALGGRLRARRARGAGVRRRTARSSGLISPTYTAATFAWGLAFALGVGLTRRALSDVARGEALRRSRRSVTSDVDDPSRAAASGRRARRPRRRSSRAGSSSRAAARSALEQLEHLRARGRVERAGRLVGEQQARLVRERPGDRDALALAAGEHRRPRVGPARRARPRASSSRARVSRSARGRRPNIAIWTFSEAVSVGRRLCAWKTNPIVVGAVGGGALEPCESAPSTAIEPASGVSSAPIRFSIVLLPEPDAPVSATSSPGSTVERDVPERRHAPALERLARRPRRRSPAPALTVGVTGRRSPSSSSRP